MFKMKKILSIAVLSFFVASPVLAAPLTLWEFYDRQNLALPSISERAEIYALINPYKVYTGSMYQNIELLDLLNSERLEQEIPSIEEQDLNDFMGGATGSSELPQVSGDFESSLVSRMDKEDVEMDLVDSVDRDGNTLSGWYGFTVDSNSSKKEYIVGNCTGSSCVSLLRGVSFDNGVSTSSDRIHTHGRGTDVSITNHPNLTIITNILNGADGIPDKIYYDDSVIISAGDDQKTLTDLAYVNALIASGVATTTQTVFGGGTEATQAQMAAGYYDVDDPRLITTRYASSTPGVATTTLPITRPDGTLHQSYINLDEEFIFTATTTSATSTAVHGEFSTLDVGTLSVPYDTASSSASSVGYVNDQSSNNTVDFDKDGISYTNSSAEETILSVTIPAGTISSSTAIRIKLTLELRDDGSSSNTSIRLKYGGSTGVTISQDTGNSGTISLDAYIFPVGESAQTMFMEIDSGGGSQGFSVYAEGATSIDSTSSQTLLLTVQGPVSNADGATLYWVVEKLEE